MSILVISIVSLLMSICVLAMQAQTGGAAFYVSPDGSDRSAGAKAEPFATPTRARRAIRELKKQRPGEGGVTVFLRAGIYGLTETFSLAEADSGTKDAPIRYRGYKGEEARIIGGVIIPPSAFGPVKNKKIRGRLDEACVDHVVVADLKALGLKEFQPWANLSRNGRGMMELFFNDKPMQIARWPNEGWQTVKKVLEPGSAPGLGKQGDLGGKFTYEGSRPRRWNVSKGVWLSGYWCYDWYDEAVRVKSIDADAQTITLAGPLNYGLGDHPHRRYYAVNLLEELDAPGEYYIDVKCGLLYFRPPAPINDATIILSVLDKPLIELKGASYVTLEGLTLEAVRAGAVSITGGTGNRVSRCLIRNTGIEAVAISGGTDNGVIGCEITQTGGGGVYIGGGDRAKLTPAGNFATDNEIHHFSRVVRTYAPAIKVDGVGNRAAHNLIHSAPHQAVAFGGNDNVMELNEIHNVCQETGDVGVFYTGRDWTVRGNVIRHNFIHHVHGPGIWGAQGIYLDDAASGSIVRGNVLYKVYRAMLCGGGRDNIIENNLIIDCPQSIMFDARGLGWMKFHVDESGIMRKRLAALPCKRPPWSTRYPELVNIMDENPAAPKGNVIRWNVLKSSGQMNLAKEVRQLSTITDNLVTAKPLGFVDADAMNFQLTDGSVVFKELPEFERIPFEKIGPRKGRGRAQKPL